MKYSFLKENSNNNRNILNKKYFLEYDQFADDEEYENAPNDIDQEVTKLLEYKLKNIYDLIDILYDNRISLEEKELYIKINKDLLKENNGYTLLCNICKNIILYNRRENISILELLLKNGADVNARNSRVDLITKDNNGETVLSTVCAIDGSNSERGSDSEIGIKTIKLLLEYGADINLKNNNNRGDSPLIISCESGKIKVTNLLLKHGANVNEKNKYGYTALMNACIGNYPRIIELLLEHGADVNAKTKSFGNTALIFACANNNPELVELLLEHGADINMKDNYGNTALIIACIENYPEIVKLLLANRADVNIQNEDGETALDCCDKRKKTIKDFLLSHGSKSGKKLKKNR